MNRLIGEHGTKLCVEEPKKKFSTESFGIHSLIKKSTRVIQVRIQKKKQIEGPQMIVTDQKFLWNLCVLFIIDNVKRRIYIEIMNDYYI